MNKFTRISLSTLLASSGLFAVAWAASGDSKTKAIAPTSCLRKLSLDLRHKGPTPAEVDRLERGASSIEDFAAEFLEGADFERVSFDWMRQEFPPTALTSDAMDVEEPARIMHHILMEDLDWRETLTGTFTIDRSGNRQEITNEPAAGILSTHYYLGSTVGSLRRNWAGRFERQFAGITLTAVTLDPNEEGDTSRDGIAANPACSGCHTDPVHGIDSVALFAECYGEDGLRIAGCQDPRTQFLLEEGAGLADLGAISARSNEFKSQAINFFFQRLFGRAFALQEANYYSDAADVFEETDYSAKSLIQHIVTTPEYCAR